MPGNPVPDKNLPDLQKAHDAFSQAITQLTALAETLRKKSDLVDSLDQDLNRRVEAQLEEWRSHIAITFAELEKAREDDAEKFAGQMRATIQAGMEDLAQSQNEVFETFKAESLPLWHDQIRAALEANKEKIQEHFVELDLDLQKRTRQLDEDAALALKHQEETTQELITEGHRRLGKRLEPIVSEIEAATRQRAEESIATILTQIAGHQDRMGALVLQHENDLSELADKADGLFDSFEQKTRKQLAAQQGDFQSLMDSALQEQQERLARLQQDIADKLNTLAQDYEAIKNKLIADAKDISSDLHLKVSENLEKTATDIYNKVHSQIMTESERRSHDFDVLSKRINQQIEQLEKSLQDVKGGLSEQGAVSRRNSAKLLGLIKAIARDYQTMKQSIQAIEMETKYLKRKIRWAALPGTLALLFILVTFVYVLFFYH